MTINYIEKGSGLHDAIRAGGYWLERRDGIWVADNESAVQSIIDGYPLSSTQDEVVAKIDSHAKALRDAVVANISPAEMSSWTIKLDEAQKYQASNNSADAPNLQTEATARGIALSDLVTKVLNKATALSALEANIAGVQGKHGDAVRALTDFGPVLSYDWSGGWPAV